MLYRNKMKKEIGIALLLTVILPLTVGCANNKDGTEHFDTELSDIVTSESTIVESDTIVQTTTEVICTEIETDYEEYETLLTFVPPDADPYEIRGHYSFSVQKNGVTVYYDDKKAQFLNADCSWADKDLYSWRYLTYADFDFDGFSDLFVPEEIGTIDNCGKYFHFTPETGTFVTWSEMDELGVIAHANYENGTLSTIGDDELNNQNTNRYEWNAGKLILCKREYFYLTEQNEEGKYYIRDFYTYENGYEELYKREQHFYKNGAEWPDVEDLSLE